MAPPASPKSLLFLSSFISLFLLIRSTTPTLLLSDLEALLLIHKDLGFRHGPGRNPCDSAGIFCELQSLGKSHTLRITGLVFESQQLNGRLSPAISKLTELKQLSLPNNHLSDQIPSQIGDCKNLEILNLKNNHFSGLIPPGLSWLIRLRVLDLAGNKFTGSLKFLKHFPNLEKLNLADNVFTGAVPASLRSFRNLGFVNFSGNSLLDYTPAEKQTNIPKRYVFAENSPSALAPAPAPGPNQADTGGGLPPSEAPKGQRRKRNKKKRIIGWSLGFTAGVIGGVISGLIFSLVFKMLLILIHGRSKDSSLRIFSQMIKTPEDLAFLEREDGLSTLSIIGKGGCGEVYKAVLPNSKEIAIKKIIQLPREPDELTSEDSKLLDKQMKQVQSEIKTVGEIRHRNLLPLLAYLPRANCHYLVYEYMKNGSLQDYLQQVAAGEKELDWLARYKIIIGIASGLKYLHADHNPRIIHRDLKPANILLDDEMEARIADFGLAKAVPETDTHASTSKVAGTLGYIAPEYYQTSKFTDKCDVYSFGIVLAVVVMGKMPSDEFFQRTDEISLVKWMRNVMTSEDPKRAIDPNLVGRGYEEQMLLVLKVACFCTRDNPKDRPNTKDVWAMLSQIEH